MNLLDAADTELAARQGWMLADVYDAASGRWIIEALPTPNNPVKSAYQAQLGLVNRARDGEALARRAIQTIMTKAAAPQKPASKKRTKK